MNNSEIIFSIFSEKIKNDIKLSYRHIENIHKLTEKVFKDFKKEDLKKITFTINETSDKKVYIKNSDEVIKLVKEKEQIHLDLLELYPQFKITYSPTKMYKQINEEFPESVKQQATVFTDRFQECNSILKILNKQKIMNKQNL